MAASPGVTALLDRPFYTGTGVGSSVPGKFPVALNGRGYLLDLASNQMKHESIPLVRNQFMTTSKPGEGSISLDDLWRRGHDSWHLGAGQAYADHPDSTEFRYNASKGVNPWTRFQLTLLPDTQLALASSATNLYLAVAGAYLYVTDGQVLKFTANATAGPPATWTSVTGNPAVTAASVCSDGNTIYTAYSASGIYTTTRNAASQSSWVTGTVGLVRYVKGRLMAANANVMWNVTAAGALPTALFTHANTDFAWVDFAEGPDAIYAAGYSGDKSLIYRIAIKPDASTLDAPVVAGELPSGEIVRSIKGYLGFLLIGTDLGVRVAKVSLTGSLTIGPLISTPGAVRGFDAQSRFVWFGWSNYDSTSTGLGRVDLSVETNPGQPGYASDLMVTGQGNVQSVRTFQAVPVFTVSGLGVYVQSVNLVASGTLDTGLETYGISDNKTAIKVEVETTPLAGSWSISLAADGAAFVLLGSQLTANTTVTTVPAGQTLGRRHELRFTLTRAAGLTTGPTFYRVTFFIDPSAALNQLLVVPFLLHKHLRMPNASEVTIDPRFELSLIESLRASREIVTYQEGTTTYTVVVKDFQWVPYERGDNSDGSFDGTCVTHLKTIG